MRPKCILKDAEHITCAYELLTHAARRAIRITGDCQIAGKGSTTCLLLPNYEVLRV